MGAKVNQFPELHPKGYDSNHSGHASGGHPTAHPQLVGSSLVLASPTTVSSVKSLGAFLLIVKSLLPSSGKYGDDRRRGFTEKTGKIYNNSALGIPWLSIWLRLCPSTAGGPGLTPD